MRILVTGSAGFIGFHLCRRLLREGFELCGIDDFNRFCGPEIKRRRQASLEGSEFAARLRFAQADVCDPCAVAELFESFRPDTVIHLAAYAGARASRDAPGAYMHNNCGGFLNVLECCRAQARIPQVIFASSSSVYGRSACAPFREESALGEPLSIYAATKHANELTAHVYADQYGMQCIGLRFFTVYGSWYRPDMALSLFAGALLRGEPLKIFNHGELERDFTYVDDVVEGIVRCLTGAQLGAYEILNIGRSNPERVLDVTELLAAELGVSARYEFLPMQAGDMRSTWADVSRMERKLGFVPATSVAAGIAVFARWFRESWAAGT
jgi:UDP-glucuronate 4-epimerase